MTRFKNPIIPGFHPDPSICRVGEDYYLVTSSFEYFPGVPIFHSRDLAHWRQIGHCLTRPSQLQLGSAGASGGIYAPTLRYHNSIFVMITTNVSDGGHFYVTAADPAGEWSEPVRVEGPGIDPSLFFDDDGKGYFSRSGEGGIWQSEIDVTTGKFVTVPGLIWNSTIGKYPEGPHLYKIGGEYYLLVAEGGTEYGHLETIARGHSPWGPWTSCPHNPILTHRSLDHPIQATGHADLVQDTAGNWWMVFLGVRPSGYFPFYHLGRETFLAPVLWQDGWPIVGEDGVVQLEMDGPLPPDHPWPEPAVRDDFDTPQLALCWNYLRNPVPGDYSLAERPGWLRLRGSAITLDEMASPTWVGRRQEHFEARVSTLLDFDPVSEGEEAGLVVWLNQNHHYEIFVARRQRQGQVIVRRRIGSLQAEVAHAGLVDGPVRLEIMASRDWYSFAFAQGDAAPAVLAQGETRYLSTEVGGMFTGIYFALYATGSGQPASSYADFDWFDYEPLGEG